MAAAAIVLSHGTEERGRAATDSAIAAVRREDTTSGHDEVRYCDFYSSDGDLCFGSKRIVPFRHYQGHGSQRMEGVGIARGGKIKTGGRGGGDLGFGFKRTVNIRHYQDQGGQKMEGVGYGRSGNMKTGSDEGKRGRELELDVMRSKITNNTARADGNSKYSDDNIRSTTHQATSSSPSRPFSPGDFACYVPDPYATKDKRKPAATLTVDVNNRSTHFDDTTGGNDVGVTTLRQVTEGKGVGLERAQHDENQDGGRRHSDPSRPTPPLTPLTPAPPLTTARCHIPPSFTAVGDEEVGILT